MLDIANRTVRDDRVAVQRHPSLHADCVQAAAMNDHCGALAMAVTAVSATLFFTGSLMLLSSFHTTDKPGKLGVAESRLRQKQQDRAEA